MNKPALLIQTSDGKPPIEECPNCGHELNYYEMCLQSDETQTIMDIMLPICKVCNVGHIDHVFRVIHKPETNDRVQ